MKKHFVVILLLAATVLTAQEKVQAIHGGTARTAALGGGPNNPYIKDYTDVFTNPAYALTYSDFLYSDIGYAFAAYSASGQYIGYTLGLNNLAVGIAIGKREGPMFAEQSLLPGSFYGSSDNMTADAQANTLPGSIIREPRSPIQLYGAFKLGAMTIGASIYRSGWSQVNDGTGLGLTTKQKLDAGQGQTGIKAGVLIELSQQITIDGAVMFRNNSSTIELTDSDTAAHTIANPSSQKYDASGSEFAVNARAIVKLSDKLEVVPQARFATFGYQPEFSQNPSVPAPANTKPNDYGRSEFEVGVGINSKFTGGMVTFGLSIQSISLKNDVTTLSGTTFQTTKNTASWLDLPKINVGAEYQVASWLTGRLGYFNRLSSMSTKTEPPSPATTTEVTIGQENGYTPNFGLNSASQQLSLGLGISIDRVAIDGYMGERFLAAGPYILSGNGQDMFCIMSMSVKF